MAIDDLPPHPPAPVSLRLQNWPLLQDGQLKATLTSSVEFASLENALAGEGKGCLRPRARVFAPPLLKRAGMVGPTKSLHCSLPLLTRARRAAG